MQPKERLRLGTSCLVVYAELSVVDRDIVIEHKLPKRTESVDWDRPAGRIMSKWPDVAVTNNHKIFGVVCYCL